MAVLRIVPDLACDDPGNIAQFMAGLLGLKSVMDMGWVHTIASDAPSATQITLASEGGSGTPVPALSIEVDDFEETLARAKALAAPISYGPVLEPWGVRRFFVQTPEGHLLNILCHADGGTN